MFVGGRMKYDLWMEPLKSHLKTFFLADIANKRNKCQFGEKAFQFQTEFVHGSFSIIKQNQLFNPEGSQLAA